MAIREWHCSSRMGSLLGILILGLGKLSFWQCVVLNAKTIARRQSLSDSIGQLRAPFILAGAFSGLLADPFRLSFRRDLWRDSLS